LGGGMRQVGVLAAPGLIALEEMPQRLHHDHANARRMAETLAADKEIELDLATVETNIVIFSLRDVAAGDVVRLAKNKHVLVSAFGPRSIRLVTHRDVSVEDCDAATEILLEVIREAA
jgi:threonine aldolase